MSTSAKLSDEQRRKIDENRRKALEKRAARLNEGKSSASANKVAAFSHSKQVRTFPQKSLPSSATSEHAKTSDSSSLTSKFSNSSAANTCRTSNTLAQTSSSSAHAHQNDSNENMKSFVSQFTRPTSSSNSFYKTDKPSGVEKLFSSNNNNNEQKFPLKNLPHQPNSGNGSESSNVKTGPSKGPTKVVKATCVLLSRNRFAVKAQFHGPLIGMFKTIPSRSYDQATTTWNFALEDYKKLISAVKSLQPGVYIEGLPKSILTLFTTTTPGTLKELSSQDINLNSIDSKLVSALMPFQKQGVMFSIRHDGRVLIADDMGLGKTVQAICVASYYRKEWPVLVICPSSVRLTWQQAFIRWLPSVDPQYINVVMTGKDKATSGLINIITYDLLTKFIDQLKAKRMRVIIADESHTIKSYKAARTKAALPLLKAATRVILLSGTPALSRPMELYTQINAVKQNLFPSFHEFGVRYCGAVENRWGWDYSGSSNMEELQLILEESIMIRRMKKEVLNELPSKRRQMVLLDPSLIKTKPLERAAKQVANARQKDQHGALLNYFYESSTSKVSAVREYVLDLLEGGHKFLVFAHHKEMLDAVTECVTAKKYKSIRIDGQTPSSKRQMLCDRFQSQKDVVVAILSITAANTGLTLTEGTAVVFAELFWNPGALVQAEDRVYRIGQKNSVNIHYLIAKGTADDYLWPLIQGKLEVLNKAGLSGDDFSNADTTTFKDPKQKTLFSCFESLIEENDEIDTILLEAENTEPSMSSPSVTMTTNNKPVNDSFEWFVDDDDSLLADCMIDAPSKGGNIRLDNNDGDNEPMAKRSKTS